jgi:exodeoxyribonuclease VII small subunit
MSKNKVNESKSFEEALESLEESVERLEAGELKLEEALQVFERGIGASRACGQWLDQARKRLQVLTADAEGEFQLDFLDADEKEGDSEH